MTTDQTNIHQPKEQAIMKRHHIHIKEMLMI